MSVEDYPVSFSLEVNVEQAYEDVRRFETVVYRALSMVSRATGSEDLKRFNTEINKAIVAVNQLRLALAALQAARMASGDPLAWATAAVSVGEALFSAGDLIMESGS